MQCKYCGAELDSQGSGKRAREYCNNAHKQADYRRRHLVQEAETIRILRKQLQQARQRITELEQLVDPSASPLLEQRKAVEPVALRDFYGRHGIDQEWVESVIEQRMLQPIKYPDGTLMLDEEGQRTFWQIFHDASGFWRSCPDCPHGGKVSPLPAIYHRKPKT